MSTATIITILIIIAVAIGAVSWVCLALLKRAKKAYWDLYHKVVQAEQQIGQQMGQQIGQVQQQIGQVQQQVKQVEHHLLLEHLEDIAARAKENNLIDSDTYDKSVQLFHELEMDNFQGKKIPENK